MSYIGRAIDEEQGFAGKGPVCTRYSANLGRGQSAFHERNEWTGEYGHGDGDSVKSGAVAVFVKKGFDYEWHGYAGRTSRAAYDTEGHAATLNPPFVHNADNWVVENKEAG